MEKKGKNYRVEPYTNEATGKTEYMICLDDGKLLIPLAKGIKSKSIAIRALNNVLEKEGKTCS